MKSGKKFIFGFLPTLLALVAILMAGCGSGAATNRSLEKAPASQQVYRTGIGVKDIATFDPAETADAASMAAQEMTFTSLVEENDKLQVTPQLATSWVVSSDGLVYTFHLRSGAEFSDGTPLTAHDVAYSIDRALSPALYTATYAPSFYLALIKDSALRGTGKISSLIGDSLIVVNDTTLKIVTTHKAAYFLQSLTYPTSWVVEKSLIDKWGTKWTDHLSDNGGQGSSGPWMVQNYNHSTGITFVPNPHYYGKQPQLKKVQYLFYQQTDTMYKAYQAGQLDSAGVPTSDVQQAEKDTAEFRKVPSLTLWYLGMNYLYKPFDNIDVRQAFSMAINRDLIANNIEKGVVTASCHIIPYGQPGYTVNLTCPGGAPTKGDPTKAKQLFQRGLQAEGLTVATFPPITFWYPTGAADVANIVTTLVQNWQATLGVTIKAEAIDFNTELQEVNQTVCQTPATPQKCLNKGLAMWWTGWIADYPDPEDWTTGQFGANASNDNVNYGQNLSSDIAQQKQVQQELAQADADLGSDRMARYNKAEQQLVNDVAWLTLYQAGTVDVIKKYVQGIVLNALGTTPPDDWGSIYVSVH